MSEARKRANALLEEAALNTKGEIAATLRELGLSGYAADAFCALVRLPQATAGDLVAKTGILDSKIYYALDELAEKGLVAVQAGEPQTDPAGAPEEAGPPPPPPRAGKHPRATAAV